MNLFGWTISRQGADKKRLSTLKKGLFEQADEALKESKWEILKQRAENLLAIDQWNRTAQAYLTTAEIQLGTYKTTARKRATAVDEQTGREFELHNEDTLDGLVANFVNFYLLVTLAFFIWLLVDTWADKHTLLRQLGYGADDGTVTVSPTYRLLAYTACAGAMGGIVDGFRSLISWHSELHAYGRNFLWKDLGLPWIGGTIGVFVYVALRAGVGVLNGDLTLGENGTLPILSAFSVASLAGFSSRRVFRWLDDRANKLFSVVDTQPKAVPDLIGRTVADAEAMLKSMKLTLGSQTVRTLEPGGDLATVDQIVAQVPAAGTVVRSNEPVNVTVIGPASRGSAPEGSAAPAEGALRAEDAAPEERGDGP